MTSNHAVEPHHRARLEYNKTRYRTRKELGMCVDCGKESAVDGHVRCADCMKNQTMAREKLKKRRTMR